MRLKPIVTALCAGALLAASLCVGQRAESDWRDGGRPCQPVLVQITKGAELEARKLAGITSK